jgi:hypothetical protein
MTTVLGLLAIVVLGALAFWALGSIALRILGALLIFAGLAGLAMQIDVFAGVLVLVIGLVAWLAGHWLYAYREHQYRSPLVERIFFQVLPRRLDPTRGWGIPVHVRSTHVVHHHHHQAPPPPAPTPPDAAALEGEASRGQSSP